MIDCNKPRTWNLSLVVIAQFVGIRASGLTWKTLKNIWERRWSKGMLTTWRRSWRNEPWWQVLRDRKPNTRMRRSATAKVRRRSAVSDGVEPASGEEAKHRSNGDGKLGFGSRRPSTCPYRLIRSSIKQSPRLPVFRSKVRLTHFTLIRVPVHQSNFKGYASQTRS